MSTSIALPVTGDDRRWGLSFGLALLAELSLLAGLWWLGQQVRPAPPPPMQIELAPPAQPAPPKVVPKPPRPHPVVHHQQPRPLPLPQPKVQAPPPPVPQSKPAIPVAASKPPPPAPVHPDTQAIKLSFESALRDAIQSAVRFPEAARMMHLSGRALVAFDWQDGRISHLRLVRSSGATILDHAALHTVQIASYPPTPAQLAGRLLAFEVWVQFTLQQN